ncbi:hypothetical protein C8R46DRAFT_1196792 [Mycena filopes]|nr:hypothetical protein C8R46DRAFT_1196792 [Mycena filopes]
MNPAPLPDGGYESDTGPRDLPRPSNFRERRQVDKVIVVPAGKKGLNRTGRAICRIMANHGWSYADLAFIFRVSSATTQRAVDNHFYNPRDNEGEDYDRVDKFDPEFREQFPPRAPMNPLPRMDLRPRATVPRPSPEIIEISSDEEVDELDNAPSSASASAPNQRPQRAAKQRCVTRIKQEVADDDEDNDVTWTPQKRRYEDPETPRAHAAMPNTRTLSERVAAKRPRLSGDKPPSKNKTTANSAPNASATSSLPRPQSLSTPLLVSSPSVRTPPNPSQASASSQRASIGGSATNPQSQQAADLERYRGFPISSNVPRTPSSSIPYAGVGLPTSMSRLSESLNPQVNPAPPPRASASTQSVPLPRRPLAAPKPPVNTPPPSLNALLKAMCDIDFSEHYALLVALGFSAPRLYTLATWRKDELQGLEGLLTTTVPEGCTPMNAFAATTFEIAVRALKPPAGVLPASAPLAQGSLLPPPGSNAQNSGTTLTMFLGNVMGMDLTAHDKLLAHQGLTIVNLSRMAGWERERMREVLGRLLLSATGEGAGGASRAMPRIKGLEVLALEVALRRAGRQAA